MAEKRYQVFISSTYEDLKEERLAVLNCLLKINCVPVGMELFPSSSTEQFEYIKKLIDSSDYYVVIIAGRYGSLASNEKSYTENEFDYALERGVPVYVFMHEHPENLETKRVKTNQKKKKKLEAFKEKAKTGRLAQFWTTPDNLVNQVVTAMHLAFENMPRTGWIRADKQFTDPEAEQRLQKALQTVHSLRERLEREQAEVVALMQRITDEHANTQKLADELAEANQRILALEKQLANKEQELATARAAAFEPPSFFKLKKGDIYRFGPYEWQVLKVEGDRALLVTKDVVERKAYNKGGGSTIWTECSLRKYLNGRDFRAKFTYEEWESILDITHEDTRESDRVFLLNRREVSQYLNSKDRVAKSEDLDAWWWLRSSNSPSGKAMNVSGDGSINSFGRAVGFPKGGVRPALWLKLS